MYQHSIFYLPCIAGNLKHRMHLSSIMQDYMERIPLIRRLYLKLEERFCSAVVEINVKSPGFITFLLLQWFLPFLQLCSLLRDTFAPFHINSPIAAAFMAVCDFSIARPLMGHKEAFHLAAAAVYVPIVVFIVGVMAKHKLHWSWPVNLGHHLVRLSTVALFMPISALMIRIIIEMGADLTSATQPYFYISIILLVIHLFFTLAISLTCFRNSLPQDLNGRDDITCRQLNRVESAGVLIKFALLWLSALSNASWRIALAVLYLLCGFSMCLLHLKRLEWYSDTALALFIAKWATLCWIGLASLALACLEQASSANVFFFVGLPVIMIGSFVCVRWRYVNLNYVKQTELTSSYAFILYARCQLRQFMMQHTAQAAWQDMTVEIHREKMRTVENMNTILKFAHSLFPDCTVLLGFNVSFYSTLANNPTLALRYLALLEEKESFLDIRYMTHELRKNVEAHAKKIRSEDVERYLEFKTIKTDGDNALLSAAQYLIQWWSELMKSSPSIDVLSDIGHSARSYLLRSLTCYHRLLELNPHSIPTLRILAFLHLNITGDVGKSVAYFETAENYDTIRKSEACRTWGLDPSCGKNGNSEAGNILLLKSDTKLDIFDDRNGVISVSVLENTYCHILSVNQTLKKIFGLSNTMDVVHKNVSLLMPRELGSQHDRVIDNFMLKRRHSIFGKTRLTFGVNATNGFLIPIHLYVRQADESTLIGVMQKSMLRQGECYVMLAPEQGKKAACVSQATQEFFQIFGISRKSVFSGRATLSQILPCLATDDEDELDVVWRKMSSKSGLDMLGKHAVSGKNIHVHVSSVEIPLIDYTVTFMRLTTANIVDDELQYDSESDFEQDDFPSKPIPPSVHHKTYTLNSDSNPVMSARFQSPFLTRANLPNLPGTILDISSSYIDAPELANYQSQENSHAPEKENPELNHLVLTIPASPENISTFPSSSSNNMSTLASKNYIIDRSSFPSSASEAPPSPSSSPTNSSAASTTSCAATSNANNSEIPLTPQQTHRAYSSSMQHTTDNAAAMLPRAIQPLPQTDAATDRLRHEQTRAEITSADLTSVYQAAPHYTQSSVGAQAPLAQPASLIHPAQKHPTPPSVYRASSIYRTSSQFTPPPAYSTLSSPYMTPQPANVPAEGLEERADSGNMQFRTGCTTFGFPNEKNSRSLFSAQQGQTYAYLSASVAGKMEEPPVFSNYSRRSSSTIPKSEFPYDFLAKKSSLPASEYSAAHTQQGSPALNALYDNNVNIDGRNVDKTRLHSSKDKRTHLSKRLLKAVTLDNSNTTKSLQILTTVSIGLVLGLLAVAIVSYVMMTVWLTDMHTIYEMAYKSSFRSSFIADLLCTISSYSDVLAYASDPYLYLNYVYLPSVHANPGMDVVFGDLTNRFLGNIADFGAISAIIDNYHLERHAQRILTIRNENTMRLEQLIGGTPTFTSISLKESAATFTAMSNRLAYLDLNALPDNDINKDVGYFWLVANGPHRLRDVAAEYTALNLASFYAHKQDVSLIPIYAFVISLVAMFAAIWWVIKPTVAKVEQSKSDVVAMLLEIPVGVRRTLRRKVLSVYQHMVQIDGVAKTQKSAVKCIISQEDQDQGQDTDDHSFSESMTRKLLGYDDMGSENAYSVQLEFFSGKNHVEQNIPDSGESVASQRVGSTYRWSSSVNTGNMSAEAAMEAGLGKGNPDFSSQRQIVRNIPKGIFASNSGTTGQVVQDLRAGDITELAARPQRDIAQESGKNNSFLGRRTIRVLYGKYAVFIAIIAAYFIALSIMTDQMLTQKGILADTFTSLIRSTPLMQMAWYSAKLHLTTDEADLVANHPNSPHLRIGNFTENAISAFSQAFTQRREVVFGNSQSSSSGAFKVEVLHIDELNQLNFGDVCDIPDQRFHELDVHPGAYFFTHCREVANGLLQKGLNTLWLHVSELLIPLLDAKLANIMYYYHHPDQMPPHLTQDIVTEVIKSIRKVDEYLNYYIQPLNKYYAAILFEAALKLRQAFLDLRVLFLVVYCASLLILYVGVLAPTARSLSVAAEKTKSLILLLPSDAIHYAPSIHKYIDQHINIQE